MLKLLATICINAALIDATGRMKPNVTNQSPPSELTAVMFLAITYLLNLYTPRNYAPFKRKVFLYAALVFFKNYGLKTIK